MNHTTRVYPRSLSDAFPDVRASCIEIHKPTTPLGHRVVRWLSSILLALLVGAIALGY